MHLYTNQDGKAIMDWEGRDPEKYTDELVEHLIISLLEKQNKCKYKPCKETKTQN